MARISLLGNVEEYPRNEAPTCDPCKLMVDGKALSDRTLTTQCQCYGFTVRKQRRRGSYASLSGLKQLFKGLSKALLKTF